MLRSGYLSGAKLKAQLKLTEREDSGDENDEVKNKDKKAEEDENEYQDYVVQPDSENGPLEPTVKSKY